VLVSMAIVGIAVTSLYAGFSVGFAMTAAAREDLRATQIILEKFETIRLYTWDQVNSNGFIPLQFSTPYEFNDTNTTFFFSGQLTISSAPGNNSYDSDMKLIKVHVAWPAGGVGRLREREMTTLISRFGLQNYVY